MYKRKSECGTKKIQNNLKRKRSPGDLMLEARIVGKDKIIERSGLHWNKGKGLSQDKSSLSWASNLGKEKKQQIQAAASVIHGVQNSSQVGTKLCQLSPHGSGFRENISMYSLFSSLCTHEECISKVLVESSSVIKESCLRPHNVAEQFLDKDLERARRSEEWFSEAVKVKCELHWRPQCVKFARATGYLPSRTSNRGWDKPKEKKCLLDRKAERQVPSK